jgi:hypothetical protein
MQQWRQRGALTTERGRGEADRCTITYQAPCCKIVQPGLICDTTHRPGRTMHVCWLGLDNFHQHTCGSGYRSTCGCHPAGASLMMIIPDFLLSLNPTHTPEIPNEHPRNVGKEQRVLMHEKEPTTLINFISLNYISYLTNLSSCPGDDIISPA